MDPSVSCTQLPVVPSFRLGDTLGVTYVANLVVVMLYGVTSLQTFIYYSRYPEDKKIVKILVFFLWVIDGLHVAMISHAFYFYTVQNYSNPAALLEVPWSLMVSVEFTTLSDTVVRAMYGFRIWHLSGKSKFLAAIIFMSSALCFAGAQILVSAGTRGPTYVNLSSSSSAWIFYLSLGAVAGADLLIATSLCVLLRQQYLTSLTKRTRSILRVLILYTIHTSALTSLCAIISLVTYATMKNLVYQAIFFVLPKLYLNSLLAAMNGRKALREMNTGRIISIPMSQVTTSRLGVRRAINSTSSSDQVVDIRIDKTIEMSYDSIGGGPMKFAPGTG